MVTNKEILDAELYAIGDRLAIALHGAQTGRKTSRQLKHPLWTKINIWADSQVAIRRLQHMDPGPGQWLARYINGRAQQLMEYTTEVEIYWVPEPISVEWNRKANKAAKESAERACTRRCPEKFASLAHISRKVTERKLKEVKQWFRTVSNGRPSLQRVQYDPALQSQGPNVAAMEKAVQVSRRYFQLKSGHTVTGIYPKCIGMAETDQWWECAS